MKVRLRQWIGLSMMAALIGSRALALDLYVSPKGSDANQGNKKAPFLTLEKARDTIRELKKNGGLPRGGVTVNLVGGEYVLTNTFTLTPEDSGEAGRPITYQAVRGAQAVLSGARVIEGWRPVTGVISGITEKAKGHLFEAEIPKNWRFHYFYVDEKRQQVARFPNEDNWHKWPSYASYGHEGIVFWTNSFLFNLPNNGDVEMVILPNEFWNTIVTLRGINPQKRLANFATQNPVRPAKYMPGWMPHEVCLLNAIPFLDEPGEWCVDTAAGKVYYWPPDGTMAGKRTLAPGPGMYRLVQFQSDAEAGPVVHHVNIRGLTFRYVDRLEEEKWPADWLMRNSESSDAALYLQGVEDCELTDNKIMDVGACGLTLAYRVKRVNVTGNEILRTGSCGIYLFGWGPGALNSSRENTISRNTVIDVGQAPYWHAAGISLYSSSHNTITHNFLRNMPYAGVSIADTMSTGFPKPDQLKLKKYPAPLDRANVYARWRYHELPLDIVITETNVEAYLHSGDNVVKRNVVDNYMDKLSDGGGLYCWAVGNNGQWIENILVRTNSALKANGIYMDDETDLALVQGNRCYGPISLFWFDNSHSGKGKPIEEMCERTTPMVKASGKSTNRYIDNIGTTTNKPAGYDELLNLIVKDVQKQGGWPGNPALPHVP